MLRSAVIGVGVKRGGRVVPLPAHVQPMLANLADGLPSDTEHYAFEWKWDGVRALTFVEHGTLRIESRNLLDVTHQYPELHPLAGALSCHASPAISMAARSPCASPRVAASAFQGGLRSGLIRSTR